MHTCVHSRKFTPDHIRYKTKKQQRERFAKYLLGVNLLLLGDRPRSLIDMQHKLHNNVPEEDWNKKKACFLGTESRLKELEGV